MKKFLKNQSGDTNIISILIVLAVVIVIVMLFKDYAIDFFSKLFS